ncbi:polycystin-1-like protein 3 [Tiliqua scincoides]|uniref:polycystin-1-like protein 3 n=1 Tax=Tiliqua scincoides TaxID=71010 RepID=UPI0034626602
MELPTGVWLWLWAWVRLTQGEPWPSCLQHQPGAEGACYELVRVPQSFPAARAWCWQHRGQLLHSWDQHSAGFLQGQLDSGSKSWVGPDAAALLEEQKASQWGLGHGRTADCPAIIRRDSQFWARREPCSEELFFTCQFGPARLHRDVSTPRQQSACKRMACGLRQRTTATPGATGASTGPLSTQPAITPHPQSSIHTPASTDGQPTVQLAPDTYPSLGSRPRLSTQAQPSSQPETIPSPRTILQPEFTQAPPALHPALSSLEPAPDSGPGFGREPLPTSKANVEDSPPTTPGPLMSSSRPLPPGTMEQALEKLLFRLSQEVQAPVPPQLLERAAWELEGLTSLHAQLSGAAQADASHALLLLSSWLPTALPDSNISTTAALALFRSLGNLLQARDTNPPTPGQGDVGSQSGEEATLEEMLAALPQIQAGLLLGHLPTESSVVLASPALSTTLSSCSATSLPGHSFRLAKPAPLEVTFPPASSLAPLLSHHHDQVQVQIASFALNPFRHLDQMPVKHVASVALWTKDGPLDVHSLAEEMKIAFGGEGDAEPPTTSLTDHTGSFRMAVNITSTEDALLVSVRPGAPLQVVLCLESDLQLPSNCCLLNTTLPQGRWQEEGAYVWLVPPEALQQHSPGTYYISAELTPVSQDHRNLSISVVSTGCYYWANQHQAWRSDGCRVGPQSTLRSTQCLCNHLSFFGCVSLVLPCTINLQHVGQLLSRIDQNPAGVALLSGLLLGYGAAVLWAHRKQRTDLGKVRVTLLADNEAGAHFPYLVQVFTGYRRGAGTSAKVILTLYGAEGRSEPHLLQHPQTPCLERGEMDAFLFATRRPLGDLHAIRLWHNSAGPDPSWFVHRLVVSDLRARKKWHFLCNCWLAADLDDGQVDRVFVAASERELLSFGNLFWTGLMEKLTQEHLWLSVITCSPWSPFTRLQRLSCCLALQLCSMLINIMFWKSPPAGEHAQEPEGSFVVTWQDLVVSMEAAVLLLPIHLLTVHAFRLIHPPVPLKPPPAKTECLPTSTPPRSVAMVARIQQELTETLGFLYKNRLCQGGDTGWLPGASTQVPELVAGLSRLLRSYLQHLNNSEVPPQERSCSLHRYLSHVLKDLEAQLQGLEHDGLRDQLHAVEQLLILRQHQEQHKPWPHTKEPSPPCLFSGSSQRSSFPMEDPARQALPLSRCLPRRWSFVCWAALGAISLVSAFFTVLYSLELSRDQATRWVVTVLLSLLQSLLLMQPLKVLALTFVFSLVRKQEPGLDQGQEQQLHQALGLAESLGQLAIPGSRPVYRPPPLKLGTAQPKERAVNEKKLCSLLREIVVQLAFLAVLMVLSYIERSPSEFYLTDVLQKSFTDQLDRVHTTEQLYSWARHSLLPPLYGNSEGLAMNGNFFLVGSARLRQIRVQGVPQQPGLPCFIHCDSSLTDGSRPAWGAPGPDGGAQETAWVYQSEASLQEYPIWGTFAVYPGGGYVANLGTNASHATSVLHYLEEKNWLDKDTRAVLAEFVLYNANVNLFCVITLLWETNSIGKEGGPFLGSAELQTVCLYLSRHTLVPLAFAQVAFLLLILYYALVQGQHLKHQKWLYFHRKRNLLDASTLLLSVAAVGLYVKRHLLTECILQQYRQNHSSFISFYETVKVDSGLTYLIAFLVALATVKLWHLLQLNPRLYLISQTLQKAWDEVLGFLLALLVLLVGYAIVCNLLFGWSIDNYKTFFDSAVTIVGLLIGIFNYEVVFALDPVLGSLLICTSVISMVFVIMNLFVSVLLTTLTTEMKASQDKRGQPLLEDDGEETRSQEGGLWEKQEQCAGHMTPAGSERHIWATLRQGRDPSKMEVYACFCADRKQKDQWAREASTEMGGSYANLGPSREVKAPEGSLRTWRAKLAGAQSISSAIAQAPGEGEVGTHVGPTKMA